MKVKLTKQLLKSIEPGERDIILRDTATPGLIAKITPASKIVFLYYYRARGVERRPRLGVFPTMSIDDARDAAQVLAGEVALGNDPSIARQRARQQVPLRDFWKRFATDAARRWKLRTRAECERLWTVEIEPHLGAMRIGEIKRQDISRLHQSLVDRPVLANRVLSLVRSMFNRARDWGVLEGENPANGIKPFRERAREKFLNREELALLFQAIDHEERLGGQQAVEHLAQTPEQVDAALESRGRVRRKRDGTPDRRHLRESESRGITTHAAALFRLLVATGARLSEIKDAKWQWLDWERAALDLPDAKAGKRTIRLNAPALAELRRLHEARSQDVWIIEGTRKGKPLINARKPWLRVCQRANRIANDARRKQNLAPLDPPPFSGLRLHDLRHSHASLLAAEGASLLVIGAVLGHRQSATAARYSHLVDDPIAAASNEVGDVLAGLMKAT